MSPRKPRPPGPSARERRAISCTDLEWEEARELARRQGTSITRLLVEAALDPPPHIFAEMEDQRMPPHSLIHSWLLRCRSMAYSMTSSSLSSFTLRLTSPTCLRLALH